MSDEELEFLVTKLKNGEDDGVDIMKAWIAIESYIRSLEFIRSLGESYASSSDSVCEIADNANDFLRSIGQFKESK